MHKSVFAHFFLYIFFKLTKLLKGNVDVLKHSTVCNTARLDFCFVALRVSFSLLFFVGSQENGKGVVKVSR